MIQGQKVYAQSKPGWLLMFQPAFAWTAILTLILITAICIVGGGGTSKALRFAYPVLSFAVAVLLYRRYPILYVGFTWWVWFLTPLVARLVDYRSGVWDVQRLMLVSPYLVTLVSGWTFVRQIPRLREEGLPFVLAFMSVSYGTSIGLINGSLPLVARTALDWATPILFGFHLVTKWREYPAYRENILRVFLWCVLVTGAYGVYQYLVAPQWDCLWLIESGMTSSSGRPEPLGIRVWSTMHAPGPFASVMMTGVLLLFNNQGPLVWPASILGYLALLVSLVRTAWVGWAVGLSLLVTSLKPQLQMRIVIMVAFLSICIVPLVLIDPFAEVLTTRFQTFSNISEDGSYGARNEIYQATFETAITNFVGRGIGRGVGDSGLMDLLFSLGWIGTIFYLGSTLMLLLVLFRNPTRGGDFFMSAARAIPLTILMQLVIATTTGGLCGMIFWAFAGIGMAGFKYYQQRQ